MYKYMYIHIFFFSLPRNLFRLVSFYCSLCVRTHRAVNKEPLNTNEEEEGGVKVTEEKKIESVVKLTLPFRCIARGPM